MLILHNRTVSGLPLLNRYHSFYSILWILLYPKRCTQMCIHDILEYIPYRFSRIERNLLHIKSLAQYLSTRFFPTIRMQSNRIHATNMSPSETLHPFSNLCRNSDSTFVVLVVLIITPYMSFVKQKNLGRTKSRRGFPYPILFRKLKSYSVNHNCFKRVQIHQLRDGYIAL